MSRWILFAAQHRRSGRRQPALARPSCTICELAPVFDKRTLTQRRIESERAMILVIPTTRGRCLALAKPSRTLCSNCLICSTI